MGKESVKLVANNKKAYHDYFIDEKHEAGIELYGTEVKSVRMENAALKNPLYGLKKVSFLFTECTSVHMKRGIFLINIPFG